MFKALLSMIDTSITIDQLNKKNSNNLSAYLGVEFTELNEHSLAAKMPVDERTLQPFGILHGGANAALAETLGSMASYLSVDRNQFYCIGQEIKCNHIRSATSGYVHGKAEALHIGRKSHVWQVRIEREDGKLSCFSTITMTVLALTEDMKQSLDLNFLEE